MVITTQLHNGVWTDCDQGTHEDGYSGYLEVGRYYGTRGVFFISCDVKQEGTLNIILLRCRGLTQITVQQIVTLIYKTCTMENKMFAA